jgi:hypothetical protein
MGLWVYGIDPCPGRCGVTEGGRLPLVVVDCGTPGDLAVLAGRQRIVMTVGATARTLPPFCVSHGAAV